MSEAKRSPWEVGNRKAESGQDVYHWRVVYFDNDTRPHVAVGSGFGWLYLPADAFLAIADEYREEYGTP